MLKTAENQNVRLSTDARPAEQSVALQPIVSLSAFREEKENKQRIIEVPIKSTGRTPDFERITEHFTEMCRHVYAGGAEIVGLEFKWSGEHFTGVVTIDQSFSIDACDKPFEQHLKEPFNYIDF